MSRQNTLIILLFVLFAGVAKGQDPIYSQYFAAPLQLNPAFTGNTVSPHLALNYRNQWTTFSDGAQAYETYSLSYSQFSTRLNSGFGLMLLTDDAGQGLYKTTKVSGVYSYRLQIKDNLYLKLGLEGSLVRINLDWAKLEFPDQIDPILGSVSPGGTPFPTEEIQPDDLSNNYFDDDFDYLNSYYYSSLI